MDFDFEMHGIDQINSNFDDMIETAPGEANEELVELAEDIKKEIEDTAPVDEGDYEASWEILEIKEDLVYLRSDVEHAPHVIFPNPVMRGSDAADKPSQGVLHDVRGIVRSHREEAGSDWVASVREWLEGFGVE